MGLNLNIQRVIFSTIEKTISGKKSQIKEHEIKQIGGRAGRHTQDGFVSAFKPLDLRRIRESIGIQEQKATNTSSTT